MALLDAAATGDSSVLKGLLKDTDCDVDQTNEVSVTVAIRSGMLSSGPSLEIPYFHSENDVSISRDEWSVD